LTCSVFVLSGMLILESVNIQDCLYLYFCGQFAKAANICEITGTFSASGRRPVFRCHLVVILFAVCHRQQRSCTGCCYDAANFVQTSTSGLVLRRCCLETAGQTMLASCMTSHYWVSIANIVSYLQLCMFCYPLLTFSVMFFNNLFAQVLKMCSKFGFSNISAHCIFRMLPSVLWCCWLSPPPPVTEDNLCGLMDWAFTC